MELPVDARPGPIAGVENGKKTLLSFVGCCICSIGNFVISCLWMGRALRVVRLPVQTGLPESSWTGLKLR
jgi:hypothetical protein